MRIDHLQAHALSCMRGDRRLFYELSLELRSGELLHLQGGNGSGKTTLLRTLCGLFYPDAGYVTWNSKKVRQVSDEFNQSLLYIGHQLAIKLELTPLENLRISCALRGLSFAEDVLWQALEKAGLRNFEELPAKMLSQGQRRRVSLACLFVSEAPLWVLDEPFNTLDIQAASLLQGLLSDHIGEGGMVILATHQGIQLTAGKVRQLWLGE